MGYIKVFINGQRSNIWIIYTSSYSLICISDEVVWSFEFHLLRVTQHKYKSLAFFIIQLKLENLRLEIYLVNKLFIPDPRFQISETNAIFVKMSHIIQLINTTRINHRNNEYSESVWIPRQNYFQNRVKFFTLITMVNIFFNWWILFVFKSNTPSHRMLSFDCRKVT